MLSGFNVLADIFVKADSKGFRLSAPASSSGRKVSSATLLQVSPTRTNAEQAAVCTQP
jgi:hypothetical protein